VSLLGDVADHCIAVYKYYASIRLCWWWTWWPGRGVRHGRLNYCVIGMCGIYARKFVYQYVCGIVMHNTLFVCMPNCVYVYYCILLHMVVSVCWRVSPCLGDMCVCVCTVVLM